MLRLSRILLLLLLVLHSYPLARAFDELKGVALRGCVLVESPYVVEDATRHSKFSGIAINYLDRLRENLQFTIQLELWQQSWTEFISVMSTCVPKSASNPCPCDIGIGSFTMTNARVDQIQFLWPFGNDAHRMASRKSDLRVDDSDSIWFVFKTFTPGVWIVVSLGVLLHAVGTVFFGPFRRGDRNPDQAADPTSSEGSRSTLPSHLVWVAKRFPAAFLFAYAHLIGHPFAERAQNTPSFHRSAWLVLGVTTGLFLLTVYQASLTVLLFESTKRSPFRTLADFRDCNLDPSRVAIIDGGASLDFWNKAVNTTANREKCGWSTAGIPVKNLAEGFLFVKENKADYFYSLEGSVVTRANSNCDDFEAVGEPFFSTSIAFVMSKQIEKVNKNLFDTLSRETRILREQDGYPSALLLASRNSCDEVIDATITSGKLAAFFTMYVIAWTVLVVYRCIFLWKRAKHPEKYSQGSDQGNIVVMNMHDSAFRGLPPPSTQRPPSFHPFDPVYAQHVRPPDI